jgi:hypothetical protein
MKMDPAKANTMAATNQRVRAGSTLVQSTAATAGYRGLTFFNVFWPVVNSRRRAPRYVWPYNRP